MAQIDWSPLLKIYGPLGLFCAIAILLVTRLLKYIQKQHDEHIQVSQALTDDARKERDYVRQAREQEVDKFLESLRFRDEKMEKGFDEIVRALQDSRRK